jgi:hypothetical protein
VTLDTAHKILIASAIAFFLLYALWELARYTGSGEPGALALAAAAAAGAGGFAAYLRRFVRSRRARSR